MKSAHHHQGLILVYTNESSSLGIVVHDHLIFLVNQAIASQQLSYNTIRCYKLRDQLVLTLKINVTTKLVLNFVTRQVLRLEISHVFHLNTLKCVSAL